jgi:sulfate permease, SulP family
MKYTFVPKLYTVLREGYTRKQFSADLVSGIVVGIVALPLAIAFAIASGVAPEKGLYTGIIAGFLIAALGGSRVQIGGPTGAFIVIVYGIVQEYGFDGLVIATFLAGFMILGMGLARLGSIIKYMPHPLIVGFTSGIALIIFSSQVKDFLGLEMGAVPADFLEKWPAYAAHLDSINFYALGIGVFTILLTLYFHKIFGKIPGSLVAIILATLAVQIFGLPVETIESRFGAIPTTLPRPAIPSVDLATIQRLVQPAFTIAILGAIESLLSAVVADGMIGGRHRSNTELVAQGTANIFSAIFGGIPATGAIARTATNVKNGGRTPVAGIVHSLTLLAILLFAGQWAKLIPLSCLAGILVVVAYNMSEWRSFLSIARGPAGDVAVMVATFLLTVLVDLTVAIEIGLVLAAFLFMRRMIQISNVRISTDEFLNGGSETMEKLNVPKGFEVYEVSGPLFFGVAHNFKEALTNIHRQPKGLILRMRQVPFVDATGIHNLKEMLKSFLAQKITVILSGVQPDVYEPLEKAGIIEMLGPENVCSNVDAAIQRSWDIQKENPEF